MGSRSCSALLATLAAALLLGASGCGEDPAPAHAPQPRVTYEDPVYRYTVQLPAGWQRATESLTPHLVDPREILSVGTFPLRHRENRCAHVPTSALEDLGPTDALVSVQERGRRGGAAAGFPPRPAHFQFSDGSTSEASTCVRRPARFTDSFIWFSDGGRRFHALVAFGLQAPERVRREAFAILDSLRFDPSFEPDWRDSG